MLRAGAQSLPTLHQDRAFLGIGGNIRRVAGSVGRRGLVVYFGGVKQGTGHGGLDPEVDILWNIAGRFRQFQRIQLAHHYPDHIAIGIEDRPTARDGEVVLAILRGEVTAVGRYYHEPSHIRLEPTINGREPLYVPAGQIQVRGVIVGMIRNFR